MEASAPNKLTTMQCSASFLAIKHPQTKEWYFKIGSNITCHHLHLSYRFNQGCHYKVIVKVHGVLASSHWYSASSWKIQFHWVYVRDNKAFVTPFVQVATYAIRNFATLGHLELLVSFIEAFIWSLEHFSFSPSSIGHVSNFIHCVTT